MKVKECPVPYECCAYCWLKYVEELGCSIFVCHKPEDEKCPFGVKPAEVSE